MSNKFVDQFLLDRTAAVLSALNDHAKGRGTFSMIEARSVLQSLNNGSLELTNSQVVAILRHLRGKGKWREVAPNPTYIGKARARSKYRILPAGQKLIAEFKGEQVDMTLKRFWPSLKPHVKAMLLQFMENHPSGGTLSQAFQSAVDTSPDQKELHAKRALALALREGYLIEIADSSNPAPFQRVSRRTVTHTAAVYIVADGVLPVRRNQNTKPFSAPAFWIEILRALPSHLLEGEAGFTAADLHGASWEFGEFEMPQVRSAIQELLKAKFLEPARRRGRYLPSDALLQILENPLQT